MSEKQSVTEFDRSMMRRAVALAQQGSGMVAPNPMVGCVIAHEGRIIGEGYHAAFGKAHAEVNAIDSVMDKELLKQSTLYVTLEPCAHFGKTPPCADLIVRMGIQRVCIGTGDPFEAVNGKGAMRLRDAGVTVVEHVEEDACREVNRRFFCFHEKHRPYIILKWAQTLDGYMDIDRSTGERGVHWISGPATKRVVHRMRAQEAAVMVGRNTIINDNPMLTVREVQGRNPARLVLSSSPDFPSIPAIFGKEAPTLVFNNFKDSQEGYCRFIRCADVHNLDEVLGLIHKEQLLSVLVEGGASLLHSFLRQELWDEAIIITGAEPWGKGLAAPLISVPWFEEQQSGEDVIRFYRREA